jgi:hypothetical protein
MSPGQLSVSRVFVVTSFPSPLMRVATAVLTVSVLGLSTVGVYAETKSAKPDTEKKAEAPAAAPQAAPSRPQIPDKTRLGILVQSYMVALSQANFTGNFSVLHDMGAPDFQQRNSPAQLAEIFATLRKGNIDLTPIIVYSPTLSREPEYDANGLLHLNGYYKTEPQRVQFDLVLQPVSGVWRLYGISVGTVPAPTAEGATAAAPSEKPAPVPATPKRKPSKAKPN